MDANTPKIIALDMDGTVLANDHASVLPETAAVLTSCAKKGIFIVPNTGRGECLIPELNFPVRYSITCNGAVVADKLTGELIYSSFLSPDKLRRALGIIREYGIVAQLFTDTEMVVERGLIDHLDAYASRLPHYHVPYLRSGRAIVVDAFEDYYEREDARVARLNLPKGSFEHCLEVIDRIRALGEFEIITDGHNLELMNPGVTKGGGLKHLAEYLGIPVEQTAAFGDAENDISMLQCAGWGVAMGNSFDEVLEIAKYRTTTNMENGIAEFIIRNGWIEEKSFMKTNQQEGGRNMSEFPNREKALGMYLKMYEIRKYEERLYYLFLEGEMPGTLHQSHGEEASAVGMLYDLRKDDWMASTHRPAGHDLAKGVSLKSMMCEMFGKAEGCCGGKGGAMHTGDFNVGAMTANAIVGGNLPIAAGVGLAFMMQKKDNVVVCFFGDGATNEGSYHETMNAAGIWKLPVIFVCENNLYSANTSIMLTCCQENVAADRAAVYGIPSEVVDGNDVVAVNEAATRAIERARRGDGPTILELKTYRHGGHARNDACGYRPKDEAAYWINDRDPVKNFRKEILERGIVTEEELEKLEADVEQEIEDAVDYAKAAPLPRPEDALLNVYKED